MSGPEILVTGGPMVPRFPDVTGLTNGRFVVTWFETDGPYRSTQNIHARIFNADGAPFGSEFVVNTTGAAGAPEEFTPQVTALQGGGFAIAWNVVSVAGTDVRARIFHADGTPAAADFPVASIPLFQHVLGDLTVMPDGRLLVVWNSDEVNGPDPELIRGRFFNANGTPNDPDGAGPLTNQEFQIFSHGAGSIHAAALDSGRFAVTWTIDNQQVYARVFNGDGTPYDPDGGGPKTGDAFLVPSAPSPSGFAESSVVAALPGGRFVVAFSEPSTQTHVYARIFGEDGTPAGPQFMVDTEALGSAGSLSVAALADGKFEITWSAGHETSDQKVIARIFNSDGTPVDPDGAGPGSSDQFVVQATETGLQVNPASGALANGGFVAAWTSLNDGVHPPDSLIVRTLDPAAPPPAAPHLEGSLGTDVGVNAIRGTDASEVLEGFGGNDEMFGGGGNDVLVSGSGDDILDGGPGGDWLDGSSDFGTNTASYASAGAGLRASLTTPSKNTGDAAGDHYIFIDNVVGSNFGDTLAGDNSENVLTGGDGDDVLSGYGDADELFGGAGNDVLYGQGGYDRLVGGSGDDTLSGGAKGRDYFVFEAGSGHDRVVDFEDGSDRFDVRALGLSFGDLSLSPQGTAVLIDFGNGSDVLVLNVSLAQITASDFIFT